MSWRDYWDNRHKYQPEKKPTTNIWNRRLSMAHSEIILAYAICDQLAKDILSEYHTLDEYPEGSKPWHEHICKMISLIDETQNGLMQWYARESGFRFRTWLLNATKGRLDIDEYTKK